MLNQFIGMGRLTEDPVLRTTANGKSVVTFTIACDRDFQKDTADFISCVAWDKTAEFVSRYFFKGNLQSRKWQDNNGQNHTSWEIICRNVYFGDDKKREDQGNFAPPQGYGTQYGQGNFRQAPPGYQPNVYADPYPQQGYYPQQPYGQQPVYSQQPQQPNWVAQAQAAPVAEQVQPAYQQQTLAEPGEGEDDLPF